MTPLADAIQGIGIALLVFIMMRNMSKEAAKKAVVAGVLATATMTLFSYAVSERGRKNFREPDLLGTLIHGWSPSLKKKVAHLSGWPTHFLVGIGLSVLYELFKNKKSPLASPFLFGGLAGGAALLVWEMAFDSNPNPPRIDRKKFYLQLFFAHLVFGLSLEKFRNFR